MKQTFPLKTVITSKDYTLLKFISWNRPSKVREDLVEKFKKFKGFIEQIQVVYTNIFTGVWEYYIMDGQNRFKTAQALDIEYEFIVQLKSEDKNEIVDYVTAYNTARLNWSSANFVNMHADFKRKNYILIKGLHEQYKFSINTITTLLSGATARISQKAVNAGEFKPTDEETTRKIFDELAALRVYMGDKFSITNRFVLGFASFYKNTKGYNRKAVFSLTKAKRRMLITMSESSHYSSFFSNYYKA